MKVKCSRCHGSGYVEFSGIYADTLAVLRRQKKDICGAKLAALVGAKATAVNNPWRNWNGTASLSAGVTADNACSRRSEEPPPRGRSEAVPDSGSGSFAGTGVPRGGFEKTA